MTEPKMYKRRQYFIKKGYQFRFILRFCVILLAGVIVSTGLLLLFSRSSLTSTFDQSHLVIENTARAILPAVLLTNLITLGLVTLATIMVLLFLSHRLAGPLFRFEKEIKEIASGDLNKQVRLRRDDQIKEMAESLNFMTTSLRRKLLIIQKELAELSVLHLKDEISNDMAERLKKINERFETEFKL